PPGAGSRSSGLRFGCGMSPRLIEPTHRCMRSRTANARRTQAIDVTPRFLSARPAVRRRCPGSSAMEVTINGKRHQVTMADDTPLLWVIRDELGMTGTKYGCGIAQCGACTVLIDGQATRSCVTPVGSVAGQQVTTIEAIGDDAVGRRVVEAWVANQVPQ